MCGYGDGYTKITYEMLMEMNQHIVVPNRICQLKITPELAWQRLIENRTDFEKFDSLDTLKELDLNYTKYRAFDKGLYRILPIETEIEPEEVMNWTIPQINLK